MVRMPLAIVAMSLVLWLKRVSAKCDVDVVILLDFLKVGVASLGAAEEILLL